MYHGLTKPPLGSQINWAHPLTNGLVGCWILNEGAGSIVNDYSSTRNNGYIPNPNLSWRPSFVGDSIYTVYGKKTTCVKIPDHQSYSMPNMTIEWSGTIDAGSNIGYLVAKRDGATQEWFIYYDTPSRFLIYSGGTILTSSSGFSYYEVLPILSVVGVINGTTGYIYVNGNMIKTGAVGAVTNTTSPVFIGQRGDGSGGLSGVCISGKHYHARIWNRVLSPKEILSLYTSPYAMFEHRPSWMDYTEPVGGTEYRPFYHNHYQQMRIV